MTRARNDAVIVRPTNNIYTVLAGIACIALLVALVLIYLRFQTVTGGDKELFFGVL